MSLPSYKLATHAWYINIDAWRVRNFCPYCDAPLGVFHILAACQLCNHLHHAYLLLESLHYSCPGSSSEVLAFITRFGLVLLIWIFCEFSNMWHSNFHTSKKSVVLLLLLPIWLLGLRWQVPVHFIIVCCLLFKIVFRILTFRYKNIGTLIIGHYSACNILSSFMFSFVYC